MNAFFEKILVFDIKVQKRSSKTEYLICRMTKNVSLRVPLHEKRDEEIPQAHQKDSAERVRIFPQVTKRRMDFLEFGKSLVKIRRPFRSTFLAC